MVVSKDGQRNYNTEKVITQNNILNWILIALKYIVPSNDLMDVRKLFVFT
jgi:hypothetical protein